MTTLDLPFEATTALAPQVQVSLWPSRGGMQHPEALGFGPGSVGCASDRGISERGPAQRRDLGN